MLRHPHNPASDGDLALPAPVVFVDLDGSLVTTDLLWESMLRAIKQNPCLLLLVPSWIARGRAGLKRTLAERVQPDVQHLPYQQDVLQFISERKKQGARIVLATASDHIWAQAVAQHLGIFDDILASDGQRNLKGEQKLAAIEAYCRDHGFCEFAYLGDSTTDLPIWREAAEACVVQPSPSLAREVRNRCPSSQILGAYRSRAAAAFRALQPEQWSRNLLIFVPILVAREAAIRDKFPELLLGFLALCACTSAAHLFSSLLSVETDRQELRRKNLPLASGTLPIAWAVPLCGALTISGFVLAALTRSTGFTVILAIYFLLIRLGASWMRDRLWKNVLIQTALCLIVILAGGILADALVP